MGFIQTFYHHQNHSFSTFYSAGFNEITPQQNDVFYPLHWFEKNEMFDSLQMGEGDQIKERSVFYALDDE
ncbi:hypothetical protein C2W58_00374 [Bacillus pumilus]|uniref:Uncharacterized protein n=1 Tax=Bacillus pumilus TaxID=1408 RepID=A0AB34QWE9_BACPU|nr:hypothetical protein B4127_2111 [Bacillus pumilus]RAP17020.1 hypothetical protein C2W58_00374 [Bacillus pumilus]